MFATTYVAIAFTAVSHGHSCADGRNVGSIFGLQMCVKTQYFRHINMPG